MNIFDREKKDGISDTVANSNSVTLACQVVFEDNIDLVTSDEKLRKVLASFSEDGKQSDLYYLNSVLVSAGWNKNDDVFSSAQLWESRKTPVDKQFNLMHDESDIIGHITASMVVDENGQKLSDDLTVDEVPERIDILTSAVIYKSWSDIEMRERVHELIEGIDAGEWFVSMECLFDGFDYALIAEDGTSSVLPRNETSAFLTKHLRAYGGSGVYQKYKVGRVLKGICFSGKGLVNKPANSRSIIFSKDTNPFESKAEITIDNFLTAQETDMTDTVEKVDASELAAAKAEIEAVKADLTSTIDSLNSAIAEKAELATSLEIKVAELEDALATITAAKKVAEDEMYKSKKEMIAMKRKASLVSAGADEAQASELVAKFESAPDEMFESVVALIVPKKVEEVAPVEEKDETEAEAEAEAEVDDTVLDDVDVAEASINDVSNDDEVGTEKAIASASNWFSGFLKTTKNQE
jgi:hypothetical protein